MAIDRIVGAGLVGGAVPGARGIPASVERKLVSGAHQSDRAIVVGNRAGVIEWANDAWARVTGYALDESVSKPVTAFLSQAGIDDGVVEFVAGCFEQGRGCELELPIAPPSRFPETSGGAEQWIQLRVEPLFDAGGEVSDFIATATDITRRRRAERDLRLEEVDLSAIAARSLIAERAHLGVTVVVDAALERGLPPVLADPGCVESLVSQLLARSNETIGTGWGVITLWTGILGEGEGPLYSGNLTQDLPPGHWAFLEVHDTGGQPGGTGRGAVTEPFLSTRRSENALRYADAESRLLAQGAQLRMESSYVDGTSVVLFFPFASDDSDWLGVARSPGSRSS